MPDELITITVPKRTEYVDNVHRTKAYADGFEPCCLCGRAINMSKPFKMLHDIAGGAGEYLHPSCEEDYRASGNNAADMGMYPIGPECLRQNPALREYTS